MSEIGCSGGALGVWECHCGLEWQISIKVRGEGILGCDLWVDLVVI